MATQKLDLNQLLQTLLTRTGGSNISPYSGLDLTPTPPQFGGSNVDRSGPLRRLRAMDTMGSGETAAMDPKDMLSMIATMANLQTNQSESDINTKVKNAQLGDLTDKTTERQAADTLAQKFGFPNMAAFEAVSKIQDSGTRTSLVKSAQDEKRVAGLENLAKVASGMTGPDAERVSKAAMMQLAKEHGLDVAAPVTDPVNDKLRERAAARGVPVQTALASPPTAVAPTGNKTAAAPFNMNALVNPVTKPPQLYPAVADQARILGQQEGTFQPTVFHQNGPTPQTQPLFAGANFTDMAPAPKVTLQPTATPTSNLDMNRLVAPATTAPVPVSVPTTGLTSIGTPPPTINNPNIPSIGPAGAAAMAPPDPSLAGMIGAYLSRFFKGQRDQTNVTY